MSRKPAIFLCVLLFLSLGGAVAHYLFRNDKHPTFTEVDAFMRAFPVPNGWQLAEQGADVPFYFYKEKDWRYRLGIWKKIRYEHQLYIYLEKDSLRDIRVSVWHTGGQVHRIFPERHVREPEIHRFFQDAILRKYPRLPNSNDFTGTYEYH